MSLIFSPLMLTSSRMTSLVFQMMQRRKNLKKKDSITSDTDWLVLVARTGNGFAFLDIFVCLCSYFLAFRGVMLNGGPGGPRDLGKRSTHIIRRPWQRAPTSKQKVRKCFRKKKVGKDKTEKDLSTHTSAGLCVCVLPALCQVGAGCRVVWFPHVRIPIPVFSRCEGTVAP